MPGFRKLGHIFTGSVVQCPDSVIWTSPSSLSVANLLLVWKFLKSSRKVCVDF